MNTKQLIKNLAILLVFSIGFFSIYSFTTTNSKTSDLTTYDQSYYQDMGSNNLLFSFDEAIADNDKCGGDKKAKDSKDAKETTDIKCGDGKCGDDKKAKEDKDGKCGDDKTAKDSIIDKKAAEGKEAKCGTGKSG